MAFPFTGEIKVTVDFLVPVEVPWTGAGLTPRPQSGPRCAPHTRAPDSDVEIAAPPTGLGRSEEEIGILLKEVRESLSLIHCCTVLSPDSWYMPSCALGRAMGLSAPWTWQGMRGVCYRKCFSPYHFQSLHLLSLVGPDPTPHSARLGCLPSWGSATKSL